MIQITLRAEPVFAYLLLLVELQRSMNFIGSIEQEDKDRVSMCGNKMHRVKIMSNIEYRVLSGELIRSQVLYAYMQ